MSLRYLGSKAKVRKVSETSDVYFDTLEPSEDNLQIDFEDDASELPNDEAELAEVQVDVHQQQMDLDVHEIDLPMDVLEQQPDNDVRQPADALVSCYS
jgi:hypothetical protein